MTRLFTSAALALALGFGAATTASADTSYLTVGAFDYVESGSSYIDLGTVRAASAGVVAIYDNDGTLLGSVPVAAGANSNVRVDLDRQLLNRATAVLEIGGQAVDSATIRIS